MNYKSDCGFELRSDKVRNIVGQIPSSLIRYGISVIGIVVLSLIAITSFLPYRKIYFGTACVNHVPLNYTDSVNVIILLKFESNQIEHPENLKIILESQYGVLHGRILDISQLRDTLDRRKATCSFRSSEIKSVENQTLDFYIIQESNTYLQKILGK